MLDFRREQVDRVQLTVAQQERHCVELRQQLANCQDSIQQSMAEQRQWQTSANALFDPTQGQHFSQFLWRIKQQTFIIENEIAKQDERLDKLREALRVAVMRQKSLELLRDKAKKEFNQHQAKLEADFLDELSQSRLLRKRQEEQRQHQHQ